MRHSGHAGINGSPARGGNRCLALRLTAALLLAWIAPAAGIGGEATGKADGTRSVPATSTGHNLFNYFKRSAALNVQTTPHPAVVRVLVSEPHSQANGTGTYVAAYDRYGLVVTNWHVVREVAGKIEVIFPDGFRSAATILKTDPDWDLAALLIWRPRGEPLSISPAAPQPGDALTIAGYGQGDYRAVTGKCTQYVAPSPKHPYEIVELAAQARQGDSGGPIINDRGELAGVLFGASRGSTSGSYCGRVRQFLATAWPYLDVPPSTAPVESPSPAIDRPLVAFQPAASNPANESAGPHTQLVPVDQPAPVAQPAVRPDLAGESRAADLSTGAPRIAFTPPPSLDARPGGSFNWEQLAGPTRFDHAKTILAVIGILTVWGHLARWLTR
jgi:S1-C subfamily serine protease